MNEGWIKLYWETKDSLVYSNGSILALWIHILLSVARKKRVLRNGSELDVGECIINSKEVAKWLEISDRTVRRYVQVLVREGAVSVRKRDRNGTHISVCNWGTYQKSDASGVQQVQRKCNASATKRRRIDAQTESPKSPKSLESRKGGGATAQFAPPTVSEVREYCQERGNTVDPERFVDYYQAQGWKLANGRAMKDWKAAVRSTWEKNTQVAAKSGGDPRGNNALIQSMIERGDFDESA